jgi:hypothetical protein
VLTLEVQEPVVVGLSVLCTLRVTNRGATPVVISSRLNLMEGDLLLTVVGPDGSSRELRGWQADTMLRQVTLAPNEQLVGTMNLLETEAGPVFPTPGRFQLQAEFSPSPQSDAVTSARLDVNVRAPQTETERGAAKLLSNEAVRRSIVLAQNDASPNEMAQLAKAFPETLDGKLAQLIRGAAGEATQDTNDFSSRDSSISDVPLISALRTPFSHVGRRLAEDFAAKIETLDVAKEGAEKASLDTALRIVKGKPIQAPPAETKGKVG